MSAALYLKQSICQLQNPEMIKALSKYYTSNNHEFTSNITQKAYKCFECCILVDNSKYCAGFGRNEEEASLNAGRIALESIIDSGDIDGIRKILEPAEEIEAKEEKKEIEIKEEKKEIVKEEKKKIEKEEKNELKHLLDTIGALEYYEAFNKDKISYEDLSKMNLESIKSLVPLGIALKMYSFFNPSSCEISKLQEYNEVYNI